MRSELRFWCAIGVVAAGYAACAYPDFEYGTGKSSTSHPTATGTGGSAAGGASGGSTSTTTDGTGGESPCVLGEQGNCGAGKKCSVVDVVSGETGCVIAGSKDEHYTCTDDTDCREGTWCDTVYKVCQRLCINVDDCLFEVQGECVQGRRLDVSTSSYKGIPGLKHCYGNCDPMDGSPCPTDSNVTCVYAGADGFSCAKSGNLKEDSACQYSGDCAAGLLCVGKTGGTCKSWCKPAWGFTCPWLGECGGLTPAIYYQKIQMGFCP